MDAAELRSAWLILRDLLEVALNPRRAVADLSQHLGSVDELGSQYPLQGTRRFGLHGGPARHPADVRFGIGTERGRGRAGNRKQKSERGARISPHSAPAMVERCQDHK